MLFILGLCLLVPSLSLNVHIVPHTHDDVGWLKTVDEYYSGANNSIQHAGVRYILTSVQQALARNPDRKFTYVEQAFFQRWWREQDETSRNLTRGQVASGQLNFVNGGWCMHDEAATHYVAMVDQTTLGHRLLKQELGVIPTVTWQLDPFGHSATQAALLSAEAGMDALFFGRIDYQDLNKRLGEQRAEFIWRASPSLGQDAQVFAGLTGSYSGGYGPPGGFDWNVNSNDEPVEDNKNLSTYNVPSRVSDFVAAALKQGASTRGENVMWTMGEDFQYESAENWFQNLDKIIKAVNLDGRVNALYSSPAIYADYKRAEAASGKVVWPLETGDNSDFFPYADGPHQFWTGYFTSRPALKRYVYTTSALFNAARQIQALTFEGRAGGLAALQTFEEALGVAQHHDGVSGTAKQHVAFDYARRLANGQTQAEGVVSEGLSLLLEGSGWTNPWSFCRRLNESVCPASQSSGSILAIWNQLGQSRTETISLPVLGPKTTVVDLASGQMLAVQVIVADETVTNYARNTGEANYTAVFQVTLPPVGVASFQVSSSPSLALPPPLPVQADVVIENAFVSLFFSGTTGRLASWTNKVTGTKITVDQNFCYYRSNRGDGVSGQPSGAYIFRPQTNTTCIPVITGPASLTVISGPLVQEVRQMFGPWISQTVRLAAGERHAEFSFTVGPVDLPDPAANHTEEQCVSWRQTINCDPNGPREPANDKPCNVYIDSGASGYCECFNGRRANPSYCGHAPFNCQQACLYLLGKEVVSRFNTSIASAGNLWTDSNGREMLHRKRDYRPMWNLSQTEPVAGNYFPCNSAVSIQDAQAQLTVLVDASVGVASITDGALELMVHRRLIADDSRGVGEALNETQATYSYASSLPGVHDGPGLVVRGRHWVSLELPSNAQRIVRTLQERLFAQPSVWFTHATEKLSAPIAPLSALSTALPPNVQLITLQVLDASSVLVRLAHLFGVGEDPIMSQPVTVDLGNLFDPSHSFRVLTIKEVSLTNNQDKSEILRKRQLASEWHSKDGARPHTWRTSAFNFEQDPSITLGPLEIKSFVFTIDN